MCGYVCGNTDGTDTRKGEKIIYLVRITAVTEKYAVTAVFVIVIYLHSHQMKGL